MIAQGVMKYKEWNKTSEVGVMGAPLLGVKTVCLDTVFSFQLLQYSFNPFSHRICLGYNFTRGSDQIDVTIF